MKLGPYLAQNGLSPGGFAKAAKIHRATVVRIIDGGGCNVSAARRIVRATLGVVGYDDLVGAEPAVGQEAGS